MIKTREARKDRIVVYGLATGRGTTKGAAYGAFTGREYESVAAVPKRDWRAIVAIGRA